MISELSKVILKGNIMKYDPIYYGDYLQLDKLLDSQRPMSEKYSKMAHDEMLFIVTHQAYELWFKQILHELDSVHEKFSAPTLDPKELDLITHRLQRVVEIQKILNEQITVMETMRPLDFMEFRDYLVPASGFQSMQFRMIELKLGLRQHHRLKEAQAFFNSRLTQQDRDKLTKMEQSPSLLDLVDKWLARMPFGQSGKYDFWQDYHQSVHKMLNSDAQIIGENKTLTDQQRELELANLERTRISFDTLFDKNRYDELLASLEVKISQGAKLSAIFIRLYSHEPILQLPNLLLDKLIMIDELFTTWRYRHAIMVHRMLGTKIGTGGSSGHEYLKKATEKNRVFTDLFDLATFLIPREYAPTLPEQERKKLAFIFED